MPSLGYVELARQQEEKAEAVVEVSEPKRRRKGREKERTQTWEESHVVPKADLTLCLGSSVPLSQGSETTAYTLEATGQHRSRRRLTYQGLRPWKWLLACWSALRA